jgi:hypothetical protein
MVKLPANLPDWTYHIAIILHSVEREYRASATTHVAANTIAVKK